MNAKKSDKVVSIKPDAIENTDLKNEASSDSVLPIQAVERETGISKELLRMWERRYDFPTPLRDSHGDRIYPKDQVIKLSILKRLIDNGFRPGKIIGMTTDELEGLLHAKYENHVKLNIDLEEGLETELIACIKNPDTNKLREYILHQLVTMGLKSFILDFLQYTNNIVGDAWMHGVIEVHEEHLYTEQIKSVISGAVSNLKPSTAPPKILLTTAPDESHTLGIIMTEAMLRLDNANAVCFGAQMPIRDIVHAAQKHHMDIIALSFSASYPTSKAIEFLEELRFRLPISTVIWAGGSALNSNRRSVDGVDLFNDLASIHNAVQAWRAPRKNRF